MRQIGGFLGRSPFGPLHEHMLKVQECANHLVPALDAFLQNDRQRLSDLVKRMDRLEGEADEIKNDIRERLSNSLFQAVVRAEIMTLLKVQDDIADACQDVAHKLDLRPITVPSTLGARLRAMGAEAVAGVHALAETTAQLRKILDSSFEREEVQKALDGTTRVRESERNVGRESQALLREIFKMETAFDPVGVVLMMQIVEEIGHIANEAENTADCIVRIIGRR